MSLRKLRHRSFYKAILSSRWVGFVPGNRISLLENGAAYFPAIEAAFDRARYEIYLETYIYENDGVGRRIADALGRAVRRGVTVRVLIDGFGSKDLPRSMLERLREDGVKILVYRPRISPWTFRRKRLRRMHRKIVVVDREIAFVGGINIIEDKDRDMAGEPVFRYDYAVAVEGPLVDVIRLSAQRLWSTVAWYTFRKGTGRYRPLPEPNGSGGTMSAAFLVRDNFRHRRDIEAAYLRAINHAKSEILIANAYFLPGRTLRRALIQAAGRGVRVILLLQGRVEFLVEYLASRALYRTLLDANIEIHAFHRGLLHAKVAVIDGHWATVGSSNIDPFSLLLSREANVVVNDETFAATLAQRLKKSLTMDGRQILSEHWHKQPFAFRIVSWLCYGLLRLMVGISGYARGKKET